MFLPYISVQAAQVASTELRGRLDAVGADAGLINPTWMELVGAAVAAGEDLTGRHTYVVETDLLNTL